jgi:hypothetical protein
MRNAVLSDRPGFQVFLAFRGPSGVLYLIWLGAELSLTRCHVRRSLMALTRRD